MVWNYAGLVVIAFLLTAVATWTDQSPTRGKTLVGLTTFWLLARIYMFILDWGVTASGIFNITFFWYSAVYIALPVIHFQNKHNYAAVLAIFVLGDTHFAFHLKMQPFDAIALMTGLQSGLITAAGFIGLIGMRIISSFTSKRPSVLRVPSPQWMVRASLWSPMLTTMLMTHSILPGLTALFVLAAGVIFIAWIYR